MTNSIKERLFLLREQMSEKGIDFYIIPTSDFHGSEYIGEYFKTREYMTGFTGSSGTAVILRHKAYLWTDGRYFIQAQKQLAGSGITLQRTGEEGVPEVEDFIREHLKKGDRIGFDGRMISAKTGEKYQKIAEEAGAFLSAGEDLAGDVWQERPPMSKEPFFLLEERYCGRGMEDKIADVRKEMQKAGADVHILSSLCDIAWLLNVRGADIAHVPVVLSHLALSQSECVWFLQKDIITQEQRNYLKERHVTVKAYEEIYDYVHALSFDAVLYDGEQVNYRIVKSLPDGVRRVDGKNPTEQLKAIKNSTEIENLILAHKKDGAAVTKFIYWIKTQIGKEEITEFSAAEYLLAKRNEQENFLDVSFDTICAYGANAAMMHYEADQESCAAIKPEGFLLVDSGGHYPEGTTDVTRTIALGPLTDAMRKHFTAVLRGNLNLAAAKFLYGCRGSNLDILAREPLWSMGEDYKCGTGHGVGYLLNVHEGPNAFRWKRRLGQEDTAVLEEGMVTTDEPGIYIENEYGIRIENELLCRKAEKNKYGQFMHFENITYVPIDLDAVDVQEMTPSERKLLNAYHKKVYETLFPYMTEEENIWLKEYTRAI